MTAKGLLMLGVVCACAAMVATPSAASPPSYLTLSPVPSSLGVGPTGFTVECWVNMTTIAPTPYDRNPRVLRCFNPHAGIPSCGDPSLDLWELVINIDGHVSKTAGFGLVSRGACSSVISDVPVGDSTYHHVACTYNGYVMKIFVDGAEAGSQLCPGKSVNVTGGRLRVGNPVGDESQPDIDAAFDGMVDEIRIWNGPRTQGDIQANMNKAISPNTPGLVAYWRLDGDYTDLVSGLTLVPTGDDVFVPDPLPALGQAINISHPGNNLPGYGQQGSYCNLNPPPACSDGVDNDGNGCVDFPNDAGCSSPTDNIESGGGQCITPRLTGAPFATEAMKTTPEWEQTLRLRVGVQDTVWIGHVASGGGGAPGTAGGYGPFHIGRGPNHFSSSRDGIWTFGDLQGNENDPFQGWWPVSLPYQNAVLTNRNDRDRPSFGLDYGNLGNYAITASSPQRTFGVTGYWHRDRGNMDAPLTDPTPSVPGPNPGWTPIAGLASAWCGLRAHGDASDRDVYGGTGNPFNQDVLDLTGSHWSEGGSLSPNGTDRNFPGYGSQWDQMLYRDVSIADLSSVNISFIYSTSMSTGRTTDPARRVGWFDKDPLKPAAPADGNFISASDAGLQAPCDSFMVYVGVPVEPVSGTDNDFMGTDGMSHDIADPTRRWFSEVVAIDKPYREILSVAGTTSPAVPLSVQLSSAVVQPMLDAMPGPGGTLRVVFRVKTNRGYDDEDSFRTGFSSGTAGAAIVDNVSVQQNGGGPNLTPDGDFELADAIDNLASPIVRWRSTGKPPSSFFHVHDVASLPYEDPCGSLISATRRCNMVGNVLSSGDHDWADRPGGLPGANDRDRQSAIVSPAINLCSTGVGQFNAMGIDQAAVATTNEIVLSLEVYQNMFDYTRTGIGFRVGWQSYPALQPNGAPVWGEVRRPSFLSMTGGGLGCVSGFGGMAAGTTARANQLIVTSNASGVPDSIRAYIEVVSRCYALPLTAVECAPTTGILFGGYFDNLAIGFVPDVNPSHVSLSISSLFQDAFPRLSGAFTPGPTFDVSTADVKTGLNTAPRTSNLHRHVIPGDTALVRAEGPGIRVDLVFRILPGVGNYVTIGSRASGVRKDPSSPAAAVANATSTNFWESYMADNGAFGTGGNGTSGPGHPGGKWNPDVWNSARCDTAERNLFPSTGNTPDLSDRVPGYWASMYHEADPKYATLGVPKKRCFLADPSPGRNVTCSSFNPVSADQCNIVCDLIGGPAPFGAYPPAWTANPATGFDPTEILGQPGMTREFTKILPDGQLTPGSHVEYFFRVSNMSVGWFELAPDTNRIVPQLVEGNFDGHRWQEFSVLPDRWKDAAFPDGGGIGMACMLVVDLGDRRSDELTWTALADSTGLTGSWRWGAHNGWHASSLVDPIGALYGSSDAISVRPHLGQAGSIWDLYQVKGGETPEPAGRLGSRYAYQGGPDLAAGKFSTSGPTVEMLTYFYRTLIVLGGDLGAGVIGPLVDQTDDDIFVLNAFVNSTEGALPRGLMALGRNLALGQVEDHPTLYPTLFGAQLRDHSYRMFSNNTASAAGFTTAAPIVAGGPYAVANGCEVDADVLATNSTVPGSQEAAFFENFGVNGPYVAGVYAPAIPSHPSQTFAGGWAIGDQGSPTLRSPLRRLFWAQALAGVFAGLNCTPLGGPVAVGDQPSSVPGSAYVNAVGLRSANPVRWGETRFSFRLAKTQKAEVRIYDVRGRAVRLVANRVFLAGQDHVLIWDGTDDAGRRLPAGVYFYQVRTPSYTGGRKVTLLN